MGRKLIVDVFETEPKPGDIVEPVTTLPYHIVAVPREGFRPGRFLSFTFRDERGNTLSEEIIDLFESQRYRP